jgi:hypothetical protein
VAAILPLPLAFDLSHDVVHLFLDAERSGLLARGKSMKLWRCCWTRPPIGASAHSISAQRSSPVIWVDSTKPRLRTGKR